MATKKFVISGLAEPITVALPDKSPETLYNKLDINPQLKNTNYVITNEDCSVFYLPLGNDLKASKLSIRINNLPKDSPIRKIAKKWQKRKTYSEIFGTSSSKTAESTSNSSNECDKFKQLRPHYLLTFAQDHQSLISILQALNNDYIQLYIKFFQLEELCDSKKQQKREILQQFLKAVLIDQIDEKNARLYLEFKPAVFLNESLKQYYIGNLHDEKTAIKKWSNDSFQLKFLLVLFKSFEKSNTKPQIEMNSDFVFNQSFVDPETKTIIQETEPNDSLNAKLEEFCNKNDPTFEIRQKIQEILLLDGKTQENHEKREDLIKKFAKVVKDTLRIPEGKREEFKDEIKKLAWKTNCKSLKASKFIENLDKYFKIDSYDAVVSNLSISGGPTGIQYDHDFPDNLGGPNTLQNAAPIHWVANNRKSDTPKEFVNLKPDPQKDWFTEKYFTECVKQYGIWVMLGRTPFSFDEKTVEELKKIENDIKKYDPKVRIENKKK